MIIRIEETTTYEVEVDPKAFVEAFPQEWDDWIAGFTYDNEDVKEFIQESVHVIGPRDLVLDSEPWLKNYTTDHDLYVQVV